MLSGSAQIGQDYPVLTSILRTLMKIVSLESFNAARFAFQHTNYTIHNNNGTVHLIILIASRNVLKRPVMTWLARRLIVMILLSHYITVVFSIPPLPFASHPLGLIQIAVLRYSTPYLRKSEKWTASWLAIIFVCHNHKIILRINNNAKWNMFLRKYAKTFSSEPIHYLNNLYKICLNKTQIVTWRSA